MFQEVQKKVEGNSAAAERMRTLTERDYWQLSQREPFSGVRKNKTGRGYEQSGDAVPAHPGVET